MKEKLKPFEWRVSTIRNLLIGLLVVVISVTIWLVHSIKDDVIWAETTRVGTGKKIVAFAGAQRMVSFFERVETDLGLLAHTEAVVEIDIGEAVELVEGVVDRYEGTPLVSVVRVSKEAKVVVSENRERSSVNLGIDVSDRDYFIWAEGQTGNSSVYLSSPIVSRGGPLTGESVVVIAVPVFNNNRFDGLLFASVGLEQLIAEYVESLVSYRESGTLLLDGDGVIISGLQRGNDVGQDVSEIIETRHFDRQVEYKRYLDEMMIGRTSWVTFSFDAGGQDEWIAGFSPIEFGGRKWTLVMMVSKAEALGRIVKFLSYTKYGLFFVGLSFVSLGVLSILGMRRAQKVWFKRGVEQSRKLIKRAKKGVGV